MEFGMRSENTGGDWLYRNSTKKITMCNVLFFLVLLCAANGQRLVSEDAGPQQTIELLVVMDKTAFDSWHERTTGEENTYNGTVSRVADFMGSAVKGVNNLFQSLSQYGLHLDVRLKKLHILNQDSWKTAYLSVGQGNRVPSDTALKQFYDWSLRVRPKLGTFDHAMLLTGYDLVNPEKPDDRIQGVAYKRVMCKEASVSIVESNFTYQVINTMAHELGHSLGAVHDEDTRCRNSPGHVMIARTDVNSTNRWSFSPCSANVMKLYIDEMNRQNTNCLVRTTTGPTPGVRLGSLMGPDEQCQMIYGPQAFFCREFYRMPQAYEKMCSSFWCSAGPQSFHCFNFIASDGFVCGNDKVCSRGNCSALETPLSISVSDACPQGDQPGIVHEDLTCSDIASTQPWLCYNDFFQAKCCHACANAKMEDAPGCEYGDKAEWCSSKMNYPFDCYQNSDTCCQSCQQYRQEDKPGCEYGDHSQECQTKLDIPIGCYANEALCCESCAKAKSAANPECPYGDRSTWCRDKLQVPYGCYRNQELCCGTCGALLNNNNNGTTRSTLNDGCEFGDKAAWCATDMNYPFDCYLNNDTCCQSCQQYRLEDSPGIAGCEYGDRHKSCEDLVYPYACYYQDNAETCCHICGLYRNASRPDCLYGDHEAFCYKMNEKHAKEQWCPLDAENGHCCGTCLYNETAIPVFGSRVKKFGLPVPK